MTGAPSLEQELLRLIDQRAEEAAWRVVRRAIGDAPGSRPEWTTIARYARSCGLGSSTVRRWARTAGLQRGPAGRFRTAELEDLVRRGGTPPPTPAPADLATERAKRAIASLTTKGGRP